MNVTVIDGMKTLQIDALGTLLGAIIVLLIGSKIKSKVNFFERFCIPAPVVGGFTFMLVNLVLHTTGALEIQFNTEYQSPFMIIFFTTVGLSTSLLILKKGGKDLMVYWVMAAVIAFTQCLVSLFGSGVLGIETMYGLVAGPPALVGGHGGATAYGTTLIEWGYDKGLIIGIAAATYGLIVGGLVGGPLGRRLITKYDLKPNENSKYANTDLDAEKKVYKPFEFMEIIQFLLIVMFCTFFGPILAKYTSNGLSALTGQKMVLPSYVGAMTLAIIIRNVNNNVNIIKFNGDLDAFNEKFGEVFLGLFLSMALMTLKLWDLQGIAGPLLILLIIQTVIVLAITYFAVFRALGSDYDAAVMCSGMVGHSLGATPTAMVNMDAITQRFGMSNKAFLIVPIVGAFLIDVVYHPMMVYFLALVNN